MAAMADPAPTVAPRALTTPRSAALAGVVFAVVFSVSVVLLRTSIPEDPYAPSDWVYDDSTRLSLALTLMPVAGIAFLWFLGVVRDRMGDLESRFFSSVYVGSGLIFLTMIFVAMALAGAIVVTVTQDSSQSNHAEVVAFGRAVMLQVTNVYALRMAAVFMISLGTSWRRTGIMPRWLVGATYLVALCLLVITSLSVWIAMVFPGWVLLVSVYVLLHVRGSGPQEVAT